MALLQLECRATFHPQQQQQQQQEEEEEHRMGTLQMWYRPVGLRTVVVATEMVQIILTWRECPMGKLVRCI
jgi:hypothetical protein